MTQASAATKRKAAIAADPDRATSPHVLALREALRAGTMSRLKTLKLRDLDIEVSHDADTVWAIVRRKSRGGIAVRIAQCPGGITAATAAREHSDEAARIEVTGVIGMLSVVLRLSDNEVPVLRTTAELTPAQPLLVPYLPRDLYPLDDRDDPLGTQGKVEAAQRGLNSGVCYLRMPEPAFGSLLYFHNFTTLAAWFQHTGTKPDGVVGGEWPELGYLPPSLSQKPLPAGETVTVHDALIAFHDDPAADEAEMAARYLTLLAAIYRQIELPPAAFHDWIDRAERSLRDLDQAPEASIRHYGFRYLHPYTAAE
ncbi:MAG: hypothetical protein NTX28_07090 [Novosphingobium sp.]|nr:hypothetical protein [Novosphingobium sp.]